MWYAQDALTQLGGAVPGLDDNVRNALVSSLTTALTPTEPTAPAAPTAVTAVAGDRSAAVTWTPPADAGSSAITGYVVTAHPGSVKIQVDAAQTNATIGGLTNGRSYTFAVAARNAAGLGPDSAPSNAVTPVGSHTDRVSVRVSGARSWHGAGVVNAHSFTIHRDRYGVITSLTGSTTVSGLAIRVNLHRTKQRHSYQTSGTVTVRNLTTGQQVTATGRGLWWFTSRRMPDGTTAAFLELPGTYRAHGHSKRVTISLALIDR